MTALIIIIGIIALLLLIAAVSGKEMNVEKSIVVNKPLNIVFDYVKHVKNHDNFSVWTMMDPEMKKQYKGTDGEVGFVFWWESEKKKNMGTGEQEIKKLEEGRMIEHELRFIKPRQDVAKAKFAFEKISETQTKVMWGFYSNMKFPSNIMKPMIKSYMGNATAQGLQNLKTVLDK